MKRSSRSPHLLLTLGVIAFALAALIFVVTAPGRAAPQTTLNRAMHALHTALVRRGHPVAADSPEATLQDVWARVQRLETYRFSARVEMTFTPRAASEMVGQVDQRVSLQMEGEQLAPDHSRLTLRVMDVPDAPALRIERRGSQVTILQGNQQVQRHLPFDPATLTADYLDFLSAATHVRRQPTDPTTDPLAADHLSRFTFQIDGARLARLYQKRLGAQLRAVLPAGLSVDVPSTVSGSLGTGELWVDENGRPRRQILDLDLPASAFYTPRVHIVVDYEFPMHGGYGSSAKDGSLSSIVHRSLSVVHRLSSAAYDLFFLLLFLVLAYTLIAYRTHRRAYAIVAIAISIIIVATPPLRDFSIARVYAAANNSPWSMPDAQSPPSSHAAHAANHVSPHTSPLPSFHSSATSANPASSCGEGDTNKDTDRDGLNDRDENCLGTDPYQADTDYDHIDDKAKLAGIEWPQGSGQMWYGNPVSPDTNNDGLNDYEEWHGPDGTAPSWDPDGDGIPNPWDDDNDNDGVPDRLDISPYAYTQVTTGLTLGVQSKTSQGRVFRI